MGYGSPQTIFIFIMPQNIRNYNILNWSIIIVGIIIRFYTYLCNRSLWLDEAYLALNILNRGFYGLLSPLDYNQGAPIFFLFIEKIAVLTFGINEYSLRFFPLALGILSILLFYNLSKRIIPPDYVFISLGIFVLLPEIIYYSSEVKQYIGDIFVGLTLCIISLKIIRNNNINNWILFTVLSCTMIWLSHPSIFILFSIFIGLIYYYKYDTRTLKSLLLSYIIITLNFSALYFLSLINLKNNNALVSYWNNYFLPFPPLSFKEIIKFIELVYKLFLFDMTFKYKLYLIYSFLNILLFIIGIFSMYRENNRYISYFIITLFITCFMASSFLKYPFHGRFLLFLLPFIIIFITKGVYFITYRFNLKKLYFQFPILLFILLIPIVNLADNLMLDPPFAHEEIKNVLKFIKYNWQDNDKILIIDSAKTAFKYYNNFYRFKDNDIIVVSSREFHSNYFIRNNKQRIWLLFSHIEKSKRNSIVDSFRFNGYIVDRYEAIGSYCYLIYF